MIYKEILVLKPNQYFFNFYLKMNQNIAAIEDYSIAKVNILQDSMLLNEIVYMITSGTKVKCGYSTTYDFAPVIILQQNSQNYVRLEHGEFCYLMCYKDYITYKLDTNNIFPECRGLSFEDYDICLSLDNIKFHFLKRDETTFLMLLQNRNKVYLDFTAWKTILNTAVFLRNFVGESQIVTLELRNFYYNHFIPTCVKLNKEKLHISEIEGFDDIEKIRAYSKLCVEMGVKMKERINHDIKIFKLFLRMQK